MGGTKTSEVEAGGGHVFFLCPHFDADRPSRLAPSLAMPGAGKLTIVQGTHIMVSRGEPGEWVFECRCGASYGSLDSETHVLLIGEPT